VVPDVVGQDDVTATDILQEAGFEVVSRDDTSPSNEPDGTVIDQDPAGGTRAPEGSVVTIVVQRVVIG
jgi:eukaryotic-like serine/threonine-protein kinase